MADEKQAKPSAAKFAGTFVIDTELGEAILMLINT